MEPLYARLEAALLERIRRDYRPGQLLPTQQALAREFGTSLITVKRALAEIGRRGYLRSTRGRGTVVLRPVVEDNRAGVSSWTDSMTGLGRAPRTVDQRARVRRPDPETARALGLRSRDRTVVLDRRRALDGEPFCLMRNELPLALAPDLAGGLPEESLYAWLRRRYDLVPRRADEEVEARAPSPPEKAFLGPATRIVVVVRRQTWLDDGRPLEVAEMIASAARYRYRVEIAR
ncbi:MAG TPA: GntR family transcriptional regulator [Planctomycetota bacterium]|nr:GntR family transcriptional regulator [Planctomycetota bacterium]